VATAVEETLAYYDFPVALSIAAISHTLVEGTY
jgi:hypothetical protein